MSEAPERIWAFHVRASGIELGEWVEDPSDTASGTEYVRADRIEALERDVKELRSQSKAEAKSFSDDYADLLDENTALLARLEAAEADKARLSEALRPFAKFAGDPKAPKSRFYLQLLVCPLGDEHPENYGPHFQRAAAALSGSGSGLRNPLEHVVEFVAKMAWRTDPPNANNKLSDTERLSAIKYHPTVKHYGQPHIELAEREAGRAALSDEVTR